MTSPRDTAIQICQRKLNIKIKGHLTVQTRNYLAIF
jgi:hypothetical protein